MGDPFGGQYHTGPTTPQRKYSFLHPPQTPRDPFASITSPQHLRVLLKESENSKKKLQQELAVALEEIKLRDDKISNLQNDVKTMLARIGQQEVTIRNQSKTIQDPRSLRVRRAMVGTLAVQTNTTQPWNTPPQTAQSFVARPQSSSLFAGQTSHIQQVLSHAHFISQQSHGATYHISQGNWLPSPMSDQRGPDGTIAGARLQQLFDPMLESNTHNVGTQEGIQTAAGELVAASASVISPYVGIEFETNATDFGGRFRSLWAKADQFAKLYGQNGEELHSLALPSNLKDHMMIDSNIDVAVQYLNNPVTRPLYTAKVINFYLCKRVLKYNEVVRGFDHFIDGEIINAKKKITHDTPGKVRHVLLTRIAEQVVAAQQMPNFKDLCLQNRESHLYQLRTLLAPLLSLDGGELPALEMLNDIITHAQDLGLDLYSCPYDARFHFPEIGEIYDPTIMINMDPSHDIGLNSKKVKMSITPYIRLGLNQYDPARVRNVCNAKVFTNLPIEKEVGLGISGLQLT